MTRTYLPKSTEELILLYEKYLSPVALIAGFLLDNYIFLDRIDSLQSYVLLTSYMLLAAVCITVINLIETGRLNGAWVLKVAPFVPVVMQFAFGGLFSGFLSVYSRSASVAVSWIFVLAIAGLLIGNERFRKLYLKFSFQISLYFITLFSFFIFFLPILFHRIGSLMFLLSGIVSVFVIALFLRVLYRIMPDLVLRERTRSLKYIAVIFLAFNILYFSNAIPPLPLALKEAGVYHGINKVGDTYVLRAEPRTWYQVYLRYNTVFRKAPGESVFVYSAVFAPTRLSTTILHEWEYYDENAKEWVRSGTFGFPITGGREGGYRGYTIRENVSAGEWRVNVKTGNGLIIGLVSFTVIDVSSPPETIEVQG